MKRPDRNILKAVLIFFIWSFLFTDSIQVTAITSAFSKQDPPDQRLLLNGRIWINQYSKVIGDQFFLTKIYLKGSVIFNGRKFENLDLKYDIRNDELVFRPESHPIILMNKEMVDSFNLVFENRYYHIFNAGNDTSGVLKGYVNILYNGPSTLYVKYIKKIQPLAVDGRYDLFIQEQNVYLKKDTEVIPVKGKKKLLSLLGDKKKEIRDFLKKNRLKLSVKDPGSFVPLLEYYDTIRK